LLRARCRARGECARLGRLQRLCCSSTARTWWPIHRLRLSSSAWPFVAPVRSRSALARPTGVKEPPQQNLGHVDRSSEFDSRYEDRIVVPQEERGFVEERQRA